jgi:glycosyltransferase involved in cell wall biosynthesis
VGMTLVQTFSPAAGCVSCVIPVYNEATRIAGVLAAVVGHPLVAEVIVVDDASTDDTVRIVNSVEAVRLVCLDRNRGKTWALHVGLQASTNSVLLLLDGDLIGLTAAHITSLISPVLEGRAEVALSLRENTPTIWKLIGLDYISGERVFGRDLLKDRLDAIEALPRFGFEVYFNTVLVERKYRIAIVPWIGVKSPFKNVKYGFLRGILGDLRMLSDILRSASPVELLRQIRVMLQLRVKPVPGGSDG